MIKAFLFTVIHSVRAQTLRLSTEQFLLGT